MGISYEGSAMNRGSEVESRVLLKRRIQGTFRNKVRKERIILKV